MKKVILFSFIISMFAINGFSATYQLADPNQKITEDSKVQISYDVSEQKTIQENTSISELKAENQKINSIVSGIMSQLKGFEEQKKRNDEKINKIRNDLKIPLVNFLVNE